MQTSNKVFNQSIKPKKVGPSVQELVVNAVSASKEKALAAGGVDVEKKRVIVKNTVKRLVANGTLLQTKGTGASGSFKLNKTEAKAKKAVKAKKPAAMKPAAAKKSSKKPAAAKKSPKKTKKPAAAKKAAAKSPRKAANWAKSPKKVKKPAAAKKAPATKAAKPKAAKPKKTAAKKK